MVLLLSMRDARLLSGVMRECDISETGLTGKTSELWTWGEWDKNSKRENRVNFCNLLSCCENKFCRKINMT